VANVINQNPIKLDTDFASFAGIAGILPGTQPLRVHKIALVATGTTVAGTVTLQDKFSSANLIAPVPVAASLTANASIYTEHFDAPLLQFGSDIKATGLTATNTTLYLWLE
jgi:hypothetical protein